MTIQQSIEFNVFPISNNTSHETSAEAIQNQSRSRNVNEHK